MTTPKKKTPRKATPKTPNAAPPEAAGLIDASPPPETPEVKKDFPPPEEVKKKTSTPPGPDTPPAQFARQGTESRPFCEGHQLPMESYGTSGGITYYRCPQHKEGCPAKAQVARATLAAAFRRARKVPPPEPGQFDARPGK